LLQRTHTMSSFIKIFSKKTAKFEITVDSEC
jgi:hypothetical protein